LRHYPEELAKAVKGYSPERANLQYEYDRARQDLALAQHRVAVAKAKLDGQPEPKAPTLRPPQRPTPPDRSANSPSTLYNGMVAPLIPFAVKGAIWYQGESNAGKAYEYRTLFPAMIKDWRARWGEGDFPFLFVQLAPFDRVQGNTWPE